MGYKKNRVIGIVGGMGPQSGLALYDCIINNTRANTDQQHLSVVLMAFPGHIEDRTLFLEGKVSANPAHKIIDIIKMLTASGAEVIGIACNTSHSPAIFEVVTAAIDKLENRPMLLSMPWEVCDHIAKHHPQVSRIGVMTTNGTYKSGLYKTMLQQRGYEVVIPDLMFQNEVIHKMIYDPEIGIKANSKRITNEVRSYCKQAISFFKENKAEAIILGCTELSLAITTGKMEGMTIIDSTACLANALIREAMANRQD